MEKMNIVSSSDDLFIEARQLIDSYVANYVAGDQISEAELELKKLKQNINKLLVGSIALIVIFKAVITAIKKSKNVDSNDDQSSNGTNKKMNKFSDDMKDYTYVEGIIQQMSKNAEVLRQTKADIKETEMALKKERKEREDIIKKYGNPSDPEVKKFLKEKDKEIAKAIKEGRKTVDDMTASYKDMKENSKRMVNIYGDEGQNVKFDTIFKTML